MTVPLRPGAATSAGHPRVGTLERVIERAPDVPTRVARRALLVGVAAALLQGTGHVVNEVALDARSWHLDADNDWNALTWLGSAVLLTAGLTAWVLGLAERRRERLVLGAALALLALDETVAWHERVGQFVARDVLGVGYGDARAVWPVALLPLLALVFLLLLRAARAAPAASGKAVLGGLGLLVAAVALEALSALIVDEPEDEQGALYAVQVAFEEGAELAGWILVGGGLIGAAYAAIAARFAEGSGRAITPP